MPSLWNKYKGSRISRLVSDLQSTPKRGNSLVVESGFPTSIADFVVKNHEKMKSSKKKHRSTPFSRSVSDSPVNPPKLDIPTCSIDVNSNLYVEEKNSRPNPSFESNRCSGNYEYEIEVEDYEKVGRVSNSNYMSIWMLVLKGVAVVVVGLYTKSFVLGVAIGACLFCLLEYLGKSVFGCFNPCEDVRRKLRGFPINHIVSKRRRWVDGKRIGKKARQVVVKREKELGENGVVSTRVIEAKMECVDSQKREIIEYEVRNVVVSRSGVEPEDKDGFASMDELVEQGNAANNLYQKELYKLEEELQRQPVFEIEVDKPFISESNCTSLTPFEPRGAKEVVECGEAESEGFETDDRNAKVKKGKKKFWKKLVPKKSKKKKNKHRKGQDQASDAGPEVPLDLIEENSQVSEAGNEQEDEEEMMDKGATSSSFSLPTLDKQEIEGVERNIGAVTAVNHSITEMLYTDECTKSSKMMKKKCRNLRSLGILGVVLAGLVGGRVFALVLTVICCLMLKMVRG